MLTSSDWPISMVSFTYYIARFFQFGKRTSLGPAVENQKRSSNIVYKTLLPDDASVIFFQATLCCFPWFYDLSFSNISTFFFQFQPSQILHQYLKLPQPISPPPPLPMYPLPQHPYPPPQVIITQCQMSHCPFGRLLLPPLS